MRTKLSSFILLGTFSVFFSSMSLEIGDEGFRYVDGKCVNEAGESGYNTNYFGQCAFFRDATLGGLNLDGIDFSGSVFTKADLSLSTINGTTFIGANLDGSKLAGTSMTEANLKGVSLVGADLTGVTADGAIFDDANLQDALLANANLSFAELNRANLSNATLTETNLNDAILVEANLENAKLSKVKLNNTDLSNTKLSGADFSEAEITGCNFSEATGSKINFEKALLRRARFDGLEFKETSFELARMENIQMQGGIFTDGNFSQATMTGGNLESANLTRCDFNDTKLDGANLKSAIFQDSKLLSVNARDTMVSGATFTNVDFRSADFTGSNLSSATLSGGKFNLSSQLGLTREQLESLGLTFIALYEFEGIQTNVPEKDLDGWNVCHSSKYNESVDHEKLRSECNGEYVMYACRRVGTTVFSLAAYGDREMVFKDTGDNQDEAVISNGVKFYYHPARSFGFAPADLPVAKNTCDFRGDKPELRFCVHGTRSRGSGYRCGNNDLNGSTDWERVIYTNN